MYNSLSFPGEDLAKLERFSDKLLLKVYQKAIQLNKEHRSKEDYIEVLEAEIRKRGLPLKAR
jgi:hypothetical protein